MRTFGKLAAVVMAGLMVVPVAGCAPAQDAGSAQVETQKSADFERGSVAVDGGRVTVTLKDTAKDGYTWYATDAIGMTENLDAEADIDVVSGSVVRVYDVDASCETTMDFYYANADDTSDICYMDTLSVETDESGNVVSATIADSEGGQTSVAL